MSTTAPTLFKSQAWRGFASVVAFAIATVTIVYLCRPVVKDNQVIEDWNATISKLGIEAVFPPEEDVAVGDVYAVLDDREGEKSSETALALRSIKLAHVDMTDEIEAGFKQSYLFPETLPRPKDINDPWTQKEFKQSVMSHPDKRTSLPLAAFPGFTIRQKQTFQVGFVDWLSTAFGLQSDSGVQLEIPLAETYGIPSTDAVTKLNAFCNDARDPKKCTDEILRRYLSFVTKQAFKRQPEGENGSTVGSRTPGSPYKYRLEIVLVYRVYLARYIDQRVHTTLRGGSTLGNERPTSAPADKIDGNAPGTEAGKSGNGASAAAEFDNSQKLKQTFLRPLVIGYRAVRLSAKDNVIDNTCQTGDGCPAKASPAATNVPPVAINAIQTADGRPAENSDARRFRLYLHSAKQPAAMVKTLTTALERVGYTIQGEEDDVDKFGAGVDYFRASDGAGATDVARIISEALGVTVRARRQPVDNPIGVLGVWLPPPGAR